MVKTVTMFSAEDGELFTNQEAALKHEHNVRVIKKNRYDDFMKTYYGRKLLEEHTLNDYSVWRVSGEDPNCDISGPHHNPYLGTYEGRLGDVIAIAVELPDFWTWGGGGKIEKIKIKKV